MVSAGFAGGGIGMTAFFTNESLIDFNGFGSKLLGHGGVCD
jgi:hypothetical protein